LCKVTPTTPRGDLSPDRYTLSSTNLRGGRFVEAHAYILAYRLDAFAPDTT
jgi:hypothetical protein